MQKTSQIKKIAVVGVMCALAFLCMFVFRFKVMFLTFDVKDAILAIVSLLYGPIWGIAAAIIVPFLEFLSVSDTGVYGLIMNILSSVTFAFVCGLVYKYKRSFGGAILAVCLAVVSMVAVMLLANLFVTPYYMHLPRGEVAALIPTLLLPFNAIKGVMNAAVTLAIYKPFTTALRRTGLLTRTQHTYRASTKTILLLVISVVIATLAVVIVLTVLGGNFELFRSL